MTKIVPIDLFYFSKKKNQSLRKMHSRCFDIMGGDGNSAFKVHFLFKTIFNVKIPSKIRLYHTKTFRFGIPVFVKSPSIKFEVMSEFSNVRKVSGVSKFYIKKQEMKTIITLKNTTEHIQVKKKMGIYLMGNIGKQFIHFQNLIQKFQTSKSDSP
jgi:hypothetical protein